MNNSISKRRHYAIVTALGLLMAVALLGRASAQDEPASQFNANKARATVAANGRSDAVLDWNNTALTAIETLGLPPPLASYCLAMSHEHAARRTMYKERGKPRPIES